MAAPLGNQFWKLRSKHGRDKLFANADLLWEAACEYFQWCDDHPYQRAEQRKGTVVIPKGFDGDLGDLGSSLVDIPTARPYTIQGLCLYLCTNTTFFRQFKAAVKDKTEQENVDFSSILHAIEETIYNQKFGGAAAGFFNANIIARDLGLRDKTELSTPEDGSAFKVTLHIGDKPASNNGGVQQ